MAEKTKRPRTKYDTERVALRLADGRKVEVTIRIPADAAGQVHWSKVGNTLSVSSDGSDLLVAPAAILAPVAPATRSRAASPFASSSTIREGEEHMAPVSSGIDDALEAKLAEAAAGGAGTEDLEKIIAEHNFLIGAAGAGRAPRHDRSAEIAAATRRLFQATVTTGTGDEVSIDLAPDGGIAMAM